MSSWMDPFTSSAADSSVTSLTVAKRRDARRWVDGTTMTPEELKAEQARLKAEFRARHPETWPEGER